MTDKPHMTVEMSRACARMTDDKRQRVLERASLIRDGAGLDENGEPRMTWAQADELALVAEGIKQPKLPGVDP